MPIFESRQNRNERIFREVRGLALVSIRAYVLDTKFMEIFEELVAAGSISANFAVDTCDYLKPVWGKGNEGKAKALTEIFTLSTASLWCRRWGVKDVASLASSIIMIINHTPTVPHFKLKHFLDMDAQFNYAQEHRDDEVLIYWTLLALDAYQACGKTAVDWSRLAFPVKALSQLLESGRIKEYMPSKKDATVMGACLVHGMEATALFRRDKGSP